MESEYVCYFLSTDGSYVWPPIVIYRPGLDAAIEIALARLASVPEHLGFDLLQDGEVRRRFFKRSHAEPL